MQVSDYDSLTPSQEWLTPLMTLHTVRTSQRSTKEHRSPTCRTFFPNVDSAQFDPQQRIPTQARISLNVISFHAGVYIQGGKTQFNAKFFREF